MSDKRKKAAALRYDTGQERAPRLVAKGQGVVAERIISLAEEHGVHITEDPDLVEVLSTLDIYEEIPEKLYAVIATLLAELYRINKKL